MKTMEVILTGALLFSFFLNGNPNFTPVIGIVYIGGGINLQIHAFPVLIKIALREKVGPNHLVGVDKSLGQLTLAPKRRIGVCLR